MKTFRVQVNGKAYFVEIEELGSAVSDVAVTQMNPPTLSVVPPQQTKPEYKATAYQTHPEEFGGEEIIDSPLPGKVISVSVKAGQPVRTGDVILVIEAMKMEHEIRSGLTGKVKEICVSSNDDVNTGDRLVIIG